VPSRPVNQRSWPKVAGRLNEPSAAIMRPSRGGLPHRGRCIGSAAPARPAVMVQRSRVRVTSSMMRGGFVLKHHRQRESSPNRTRRKSGRLRASAVCDAGSDSPAMPISMSSRRIQSTRTRNAAEMIAESYVMPSPPPSPACDSRSKACDRQHLRPTNASRRWNPRSGIDIRSENRMVDRILPMSGPVD